MNAVSSCKILGFDHSMANAPIKIGATVSFLPCSQLFRPNSSPGDFTLPRFRISYRRNKEVERLFRVPRISCLVEDNCEEYKEPVESSFSNDSQQEGTIDLKLPRRSLLVTFTCDACGARSRKLINRLAYERGLVYVQCSGCSQYHKLVDNLGLVLEYNLQEEIDFDVNVDQV